MRRPPTRRPSQALSEANVACCTAYPACRRSRPGSLTEQASTMLGDSLRRNDRPLPVNARFIGSFDRTVAVLVSWNISPWFIGRNDVKSIDEMMRCVANDVTASRRAHFPCVRSRLRRSTRIFFPGLYLEQAIYPIH